jgi:hypothetical protein
MIFRISSPLETLALMNKGGLDGLTGLGPRRKEFAVVQ